MDPDELRRRKAEAVDARPLDADAGATRARRTPTWLIVLLWVAVLLLGTWAVQSMFESTPQPVELPRDGVRRQV